MAIDEIRRMKNDIFPNLKPASGTVFNTSLMDWLDLRNSLLCAEAICLAANERKESRGAHQMEDIPFKSDKFIKNQIISMIDGNLVSRWQDVQRLKFDLQKKTLGKGMKIKINKMFSRSSIFLEALIAQNPNLKHLKFPFSKVPQSLMH